MTDRELEAIPIARGELVERWRHQALRQLAAAQRQLDELANQARIKAVDVDDVDGAIDARYDAHAIAAEWITNWRSM